MAQSPQKLTLTEAEQLALRNHPRVASASLVADAAKSAAAGARSPFYPQIAGSFTSVGAEHNSTLSAGTIQTSSLYSRVAAGVSISQLVTDFGRTSNLADAAKLRASAQEQIVGSTHATILVNVDHAYYQALAWCCGRCRRWRRVR
jgi:outer membrane protein